MMKIFSFLLLLCGVLYSQTLTFGVFTYRSSEKIMQEYLPIAEHISKELNVEVLIRPLCQDSLEKELAEGKIDLIATNPTHHLSLQKQGKTTGAIATLVKRYNDVLTPYLGGVIITKAGNNNIRSMSDLHAKTIAIPGKKFLGGYLSQVYELLKHDLNVAKNTKTLVYKDHVAVVRAVMRGDTDAGFIRSGILEEMSHEQTLKLEDIFVLNEQNFPHFPMKTSTALYPEWSITAAKTLDVETVSKIAVSLYGYKNSMPGSDIISSFTIPGDYAEIDSLARILRIPPYNHAPAFTPEDIWSEYGTSILTAVSLTSFFFILLLILYHRARFESQYAQSLLNATPSLIVTTDGKKLVDANKAFLNFVGYTNVKEFKKKHSCICELFEEGDTNIYLSANMNEQTWVDEIINNPEKEHRAKITVNGITKIFRVEISIVKYKNKFRVIAIFDDISQLVNQSSTDTLTKIANRTHFNLLFKHSLHIAQRESTPLSLIFFDIDHFKMVNDTYGHLAGDNVLRNIATLITKNLRKSDVFARWGGEEFVIILPSTSLNAAHLIAQELRQTIEDELFPEVKHITCSFGVAQLKENENTLELLERLDTLLYNAKKNGRNRVEAG